MTRSRRSIEARADRQEGPRPSHLGGAPRPGSLRVLGVAAVLRCAWILGTMEDHAHLPRAAAQHRAWRGRHTPTTDAPFTLSPDGTLLAFVARTSGRAPQLYVRRLDQLTATPLSGTDGASSPFFSPDGQWLAFFADLKLKKVPVTGGAVVTLADAPNPRGGWWAEDGTIVFAPNNRVGLMRVSAVGGQAQPVTTLRRVRSRIAFRRYCRAARRCCTPPARR